MVDIVIPFQHSINRDEELRYVLRGIEKFVPDIGAVRILGDAPRWDWQFLVVDKFIQPSTKFEYRDRNIAFKLLRYCHSVSGTNDFYIFHDDNFLLAQWDGQAYHCGPNWNGSGYYAETEKNTRELFPKADNWDLHGPHKANKQLFRRSVGSVDWNKPGGYCIKTVYHYMNGLVGTAIPDCKLKQDSPGHFESLVSGRPFFSISDEAWRYRSDIREFIQHLYLNKSRWER